MTPVPEHNAYVDNLLLSVKRHFQQNTLPCDLIARFPHLRNKTVAKLELADLWNYSGLQQSAGLDDKGEYVHDDNVSRHARVTIHQMLQWKNFNL